jgi:hypothetical protein
VLNAIHDIDAWAVALIIAFAMLVGWFFGRWHGRQLRLELQGKPAVSKFMDASLAILGLLIAFTFATAWGKYDQRRLMVISDSNAIGDFYNCASLLKEPVRTKLMRVIQNYTALRLDIAKHSYTKAGFEKALEEFDQMHTQMVELVSEALAQGTPIAVSLTNTLNAVSSMHAARLAAVRDRVPASIVLLLIVSAVICAMLVGREQGASEEDDIAGTVCFIILVSFAIWVTLDLNQGDRGLIRVDQEPIQRLLSTMSQ